jgi:hypothetical protein
MHYTQTMQIARQHGVELAAEAQAHRLAREARAARQARSTRPERREATTPTRRRWHLGALVPLTRT